MAGKPITQSPAFVAMQEQVNAIQQNSKDQGEKLDGLIDAVTTLAGAVNSVTETVGTMAKNRPVVANHYLESEDQIQGNDGDVTFTEDGGQQVLDKPSEIETERVFNEDKLRDMAFNNEYITVRIEMVSDEKAAPVFEIEVNGEKAFFRRGEVKKVKRMFVEGLARAKPINYGSQEYRGDDGLTHIRYPTTTGVRYPFQIVNPTALDEAWIQAILAQP